MQTEVFDKTGGFSTELKPFTAIIAGARLLMDMEETRHFFTLFDAVDGRQNERNYQRYLQTQTGRRLDREGVNFADILTNEIQLRGYPPHSLAGALIDFLSSENLKTELILIAEQNANISTLDLDRSRRNYIASGFAIHDLIHVVTGYGRDPIGESCVLHYTSEQLGFRGAGLFAHALALRMQATHPGVPVLKIVKEARETSKKATWMPEIDWRELLGEPLDVARRKLNIAPPRLYNRYKDRFTTQSAAPGSLTPVKDAA